MAGDQLEQSSSGLQHNAVTTDQAVQAVNAARTNMQAFLDDFSARSKGSFVEATHAASIRISDLFKQIEDRLTKYAGDSRLLDQDIQATNAAAASQVSSVAQGSGPRA
jgi:hypothetical protein